MAQDLFFEHEVIPTAVDKELYNCENSWKVKVLTLLPGDLWSPVGTGLLHIEHKNGIYSLNVCAGPRLQQILSVPINPSSEFAFSEGYLVSWMDLATGRRAGLDFFEGGADEAWDLLCHIQNRDPDDNLIGIKKDLLQQPNFENLGNIGEEISGFVYSAKKKQLIVQQCLRDDAKYLKNLVKIFHEAEEYKSQGKLILIFYVFRGLICINDLALIESMLSKELFMDVVGIFEYDPDINITLFKYRYRNFIREQVVFRNILGLTDVSMLEQINLNYRLAFFKDTAIARWMDEDTNALLSKMIDCNNDQILAAIYSTPKAATTILEKMNCGDPEEADNAVRFVLEICRYSRPNDVLRLQFFQQLADAGLIPRMLKNITEEKGGQLPVRSSEVLVNAMHIVPVRVKTIFADESDKGFPSLTSLFNILTGPQDEGLKYSVCSLLQQLLGRGPKEDVATFLPFYSFGFKRLIDSLAISPAGEFKYFPLELVTYFVKKSEPFVLLPKNGLIEKAGAFLSNKAKHVQVGGVKLIKEIVSSQDEMVCAYIGRLDLLLPLLQLIVTIQKDCLLVGTIRGLLRCISLENKVKVFPDFASRFKDFKPVQLGLFPELADIMKKCLHPPPNAPAINGLRHNIVQVRVEMAEKGEDVKTLGLELAPPNVLPLLYEIAIVHKRAHEEKTSSPLTVCENLCYDVEDKQLSKKKKKKKKLKEEETYKAPAELEIEATDCVGQHLL